MKKKTEEKKEEVEEESSEEEESEEETSEEEKQEVEEAPKARSPPASAGGFGERQMYPATCAECGNKTEVPFKPDESRPVYCRDCYMKKKPRRSFGSRPGGYRSSNY